MRIDRTKPVTVREDWPLWLREFLEHCNVQARGAEIFSKLALDESKYMEASSHERAERWFYEVGHVLVSHLQSHGVIEK